MGETEAVNQSLLAVATFYHVVPCPHTGKTCGIFTQTHHLAPPATACKLSPFSSATSERTANAPVRTTRIHAAQNVCPRRRMGSPRPRPGEPNALTDAWPGTDVRTFGYADLPGIVAEEDWGRRRRMGEMADVPPPVPILGMFRFDEEQVAADAKAMRGRIHRRRRVSVAPGRGRRRVRVLLFADAGLPV